MTEFRGSLREWAVAASAGIALATGIVWVLRGPPVPRDPVAPPPAPPAPALEPIADMSPPPVAPLASVPATAPAGMTLRGLFARPDGPAAIIEIGGGRQRLVRPGAVLGQGVTVTRIGADGVTITSNGIESRLGFDPPRDGPASVTAAAAGGDIAAWRLSVVAERGPDGISGWRVTDVSRLPRLAAAGVKVGDVLTDIDGSMLISEEKLMALPAELAANPSAQLGYRRGRQKYHTGLPASAVTNP